MSTYTITLIPLSELSFIGQTPSSYQFQSGSGSGWNWGTYKFTYSNADLVDIAVSDDDDRLQDDPANPEWSGGDFTAHSQVIGDTVTVAGTTYGAGLRIEDEYELWVRDQDGTLYRLVAVSVDDDPSNPYSGNTVIGFTFDGDWPEDGTKLTIVRGSGEDGQEMGAPVCFTGGTLIATLRGEVPVEELQTGDRVLTLDNGPRPLRLIVSRRLDAAALQRAPKLRPVRIAAGALGPRVPREDLLVSQQHRMLVSSRIALRMFDAAEVLVAAKHLIGAPGITLARDLPEVTYYHFLFDQHQIVSANGALSESLFTGPEALKTIAPEGREEILALFPELLDHPGLRPVPARLMIKGKDAKAMTARHRKHRRPFLEPLPPTAEPARA
ncbi:Hint domain-containing protein [Pseudodonghicola flavimaris]|uniref:Hint domain-containing protein n=1 Tax=Pseudodonghicola flavimaris TaxID=3050036 RepID=A0ABT7F0Q4_9RHOB|nr:Hint domain-containing protein [Pseudodonghicola flavimaris]MDK3018080.1 Hint domain-containing protein [Pseudodonghicola flavimaris]